MRGAPLRSPLCYDRHGFSGFFAFPEERQKLKSLFEYVIDVATIPLFWTNPTYNYELLAIIKYRLVTPKIFFFCIADTIPASKRSDESGTWMIWVRCQPVLLNMFI